MVLLEIFFNADLVQCLPSLGQLNINVFMDWRLAEG